jgi:Asp-tRNA(Asn)/Glu-tRNA(Gln) amidotransferase A subunit family amidase
MEVIQFTPPYNATGQPAISLPLHWNAADQPIGTHLVAGFGRADLLIQVFHNSSRSGRGKTADHRSARSKDSGGSSCWHSNLVRTGA